MFKKHVKNKQSSYIYFLNNLESLEEYKMCAKIIRTYSNGQNVLKSKQEGKNQVLKWQKVLSTTQTTWLLWLRRRAHAIATCSI